MCLELRSKVQGKERHLQTHEVTNVNNVQFDVAANFSYVEDMGDAMEVTYGANALHVIFMCGLK